MLLRLDDARASDKEQLAAADCDRADVEGITHQQHWNTAPCLLLRWCVVFAPDGVAVDGLLCSARVPGVAVAAFFAQVVDVVVQRLVAIAEDGLLRGDAVVARPERTGALLRDEMASARRAAAARVFVSADGVSL